MLEDPFNSSQCLDDISPIIVQVPQLAIVSLMGPPKWILFQHLVLLEISAYSPTLVICQSVTILLEKGIYPRDSPVP